MSENRRSLSDSIRGEEASHRRADVGPQIAEAIAEERALKLEHGMIAAEDKEGAGEDPIKQANLEDSLPLAPHMAAKLGLTSILPPMRVQDDEKFRRFLYEILDPDLRVLCPTYTSLAKRFQVSVQTIKTWLLSEEASKAIEVSIAHLARMAMPSVLRSVRLRAELTGDPHAAEYVRKVAKLGTAETEASRSFEKTLRQIAADRAALPRSQKAAVILEAEELVPIDETGP